MAVASHARPVAVRVLILAVAALAVLAVCFLGVPGRRAVHAVQPDHGGGVT